MWANSVPFGRAPSPAGATANTDWGSGRPLTAHAAHAAQTEDANPVDLERRECRIHRYKGHAVRKNVVPVFAAEALQAKRQDAWESLFETGNGVRLSNENQLIPYWVFERDAKIERRVPALPFRREIDPLYVLRRSLAIYL